MTEGIDEGDPANIFVCRKCVKNLVLSASHVWVVLIGWRELRAVGGEEDCARPLANQVPRVDDFCARFTLIGPHAF